MFSKPGTDHGTKFNIFYMIMPLSRKEADCMYFRRIPMDRQELAEEFEHNFEFKK